MGPHLPSRNRTVVSDKGVCTSCSRESRMIPYVFVQVTPNTNRSERIKQDRLMIVTARRSQVQASGCRHKCAQILTKRTTCGTHIVSTFRGVSCEEHSLSAQRQ